MLPDLNVKYTGGGDGSQKLVGSTLAAGNFSAGPKIGWLVAHPPPTCISHLEVPGLATAMSEERAPSSRPGAPRRRWSDFPRSSQILM